MNWYLPLNFINSLAISPEIYIFGFFNWAKNSVFHCFWLLGHYYLKILELLYTLGFFIDLFKLVCQFQ